LPENDRREAFFKCWTRKEAFIKAVGDGFSRALDSFDVTLGRGEPAGLLKIDGDSNAASRWSIEDLKIGLDFAAAVAIEGKNPAYHYWQWSDWVGES